MKKSTFNLFLESFITEGDTEEELLQQYDNYRTDDAKLAAAFALMTFESHERKA